MEITASLYAVYVLYTLPPQLLYITKYIAFT